MIRAMTFSKLGTRLRSFAGAREGISAVEFAIIVPFVITLYAGGVELADGLAIQYKTTLAARTVADLASQYQSIDSSTMSIILGAASSVTAPYPSSNMTVIVSEVAIDDDGEGTITWSAALHGTPHPPGQSVTLPTTMQTQNCAQSGGACSFIWGEVYYPYVPNIGTTLTGTVNIYESAFFYPRKSNCVTYNSVC
jgi:Flp pilus assembly protein TadG